MVKEQVAQKGGSLTRDQAFSVAHEYSDKLWGLHKWLGYGLSILLLWRVVIEMMLSKSDRLGTRIRKAISFPDLGGEKKHHLWVHYGYAVFYVLFFTMAITGLVLAFEDVSWLDPVHKAAKSIHSVVQYGLYAYVILHLAGVIRADLTRYGGIVSRMINGRTKEHRS